MQIETQRKAVRNPKKTNMKKKILNDAIEKRAKHTKEWMRLTS